MKTVYTTILRLLNEIEGINFIDLDKNQLNALRPAVSYPAALIRLEIPGTENLGQNKQRCNCRITIKLAFDYQGETTGHTPEDVQAESLKYFDLLDDVYEKLQGYYDTGISRINRLGLKEETRADNLKVVSMVFDTEFTV